MKITVNTDVKQNEIGDLFGIFFEDINHSADGGLYAELIQNRSFEFDAVDHPDYHGLTAWEKIEQEGCVNLLVTTGAPVSQKNPHYLAMDIKEPGSNVGVQNIGWGKGIPLKKGEHYYFTCYAKREQSIEEPITISLRSNNGTIYTQQSIYVTSSWVKYELEFVATTEDDSARLAITVSGRGKVYIDFVSLFPAKTFMGRRNGVRQDIAQLLASMQPKFMRFPGGCLIHDGALDADVRDAMYRWKNTIGPLEDRPARRNNWGYNQTLGLGFYELFQFCEDIGAKPLPVISAGYDPHHKRAVPLEEMQEWIEEAIDLIEFANGDRNTAWGGIRAKMGHSEPFHLEYLGIGNEEVGEDFFIRFEIIYKEVRKKYPAIKVIGTSGPFAAGKEFETGWESARKNKVDYVDEHFYQSPEWFLANLDRYDEYDRNGPKVFLGEYATWGNAWKNALVEAAFMIGLENNVPAVGLACYAPMLANVDYVNWRPDMIWFDNIRAYGTPNYYVQKLFMNYHGKYQLETKIEKDFEISSKCEVSNITGDILFSSDNSNVEYTEIQIINEDTREVDTFPDICVSSGEKERIKISQTNVSNYTIRCKAKELSGTNGFRIYFGEKDEQNNFCLILGGWQNQDAILEEKVNGAGSCLDQCCFSVEINREYELALCVTGRRVQTYIDGVLLHDTESKNIKLEPLYVSAQEGCEGEIFIKIVNVTNIPRELEISLPGFDLQQEIGVQTMWGWKEEDTNSFEQADFISPTEKSISVIPAQFRYSILEKSITVFRVNGR